MADKLISQLDSFSGTPSSGDYLVTDNGTNTTKISIPDLLGNTDAKDVSYSDTQTYANGTVGKKLKDLDAGDTALQQDITDLRSDLFGFFNRTGVNGVKAYFGNDHVALTDIVLQSGVTYTITNRSSIQAIFMTYNDTTTKTVSPSTKSFTLTPTKTALLCAYKNTSTTSDYIDIDINVGLVSDFNLVNRGFYGLFNEVGVLGLKRFFSADHFIETDIVLQKGVTYSFKNRSNITANFFTYDDSASVTANAGTDFTLTPTKSAVLCAYKNTSTTSDYIDVDIYMGLTKKVRELEAEIVEATEVETYTVDPNGGGDYTTFSSALADLSANTNKKIIYVKGGTYDIFDEMGGSAYASTITSSSDWTVANNIIPANTSIIGLGKVVLDYEPTDADITSGAAQILSPLNLMGGNITIENIDIIATNCRYAIHDEAGDDAVPFTHTYKNVKAHKIRGTYGKAQCFGGGLGFNETAIFEECIFKGNNSPIFSYHNNLQGVDDSSSIIMNNCVIVDPSNSNSAFGFYSTYRADGLQRYNKVKLNNTYIGGGMTLAPNGSTPTQNTFDVLTIGCTAFTATERDLTENIYPVTKYNSISV